jgi:peptidoglycan/LPS O-acetylase OafA/YrhL
MIGSAFGCLYGFSPLISPRKPASARSALSEAHGLPAQKTTVAARVFKPVSLIAIAAGVVSMIVMSFEFSFRDPRVYHYGILTVSLITAAILCLARKWQDLSPRREPGVTNYIGLRSYSIYLFHWPIMIVAGRLAERLGAAPDASSVWSAAVGIPATFIVAELSYRWVEQPFRARRRSAYATGSVGRKTGVGARRRNVASACVAAVLIAISLNAVTTAPRISNIESDLRYGAMSLDVSKLKDLYGDVIDKEKRATRNEGAKLRESSGDG